MKGIFDPNNLFFRSLSWAVDIVGISLFWLILSLPVVTIVPAGAALYHTCALCIRKGETGAFGRFFRSFLGNLRQGWVLSIPLVLGGLALAWGQDVMAQVSQTAGGGAAAAYGVYLVALLLPVGAGCWLPALLGRFEFRTRELWRTALLMTVGHLPTTVFVVAVVLGTGFACLVCVPLALVLPVAAGMVISLPMERVFKKHMDEPRT